MEKKGEKDLEPENFLTGVLFWGEIKYFGALTQTSQTDFLIYPLFIFV